MVSTEILYLSNYNFNISSFVILIQKQLLLTHAFTIASCTYLPLV